MIYTRSPVPKSPAEIPAYLQTETGRLQQALAAIERQSTIALSASTDVALTASTTIAVDELNIALGPNETWVFDYWLRFAVSGGIAGLAPIFFLPDGATGGVDAHGTLGSTTGYAYSQSATPAVAQAVAFGTASFTGFIRVRATIITTRPHPGTVGIGVTTGAAAAGHILAGSTVLAQRVAPS